MRTTCPESLYLIVICHKVELVNFQLRAQRCNHWATKPPSLQPNVLHKFSYSLTRLLAYKNNHSQKFYRLLNRSRFLSRCRWCMSACSTSGEQRSTVNTELRRRTQSLLLANTSVRPANCRTCHNNSHYRCRYQAHPGNCYVVGK